MSQVQACCPDLLVHAANQGPHSQQGSALKSTTGWCLLSRFDPTTCCLHPCSCAADQGPHSRGGSARQAPLDGGHCARAAHRRPRLHGVLQHQRKRQPQVCVLGEVRGVRRVWNGGQGLVVGKGRIWGPEQPVAGQDFTICCNTNASDSVRRGV